MFTIYFRLMLFPYSWMSRWLLLLWLAFGIVLKGIYNNRDIKATIDKREINELIKLCTKDVHFYFDGATYAQKHVVAMGSPLASILAGIFIVELEWAAFPNLPQHLKFWNCYVDDTICFICNEYQESLLSCLNSFHNFIRLTY